MYSWVHICIYIRATSLLWLLNRLQHIQGFFNITILAFKQLGQPTTLIAESHGHHLVYCFSNMWSYEQNYLLSTGCYMIWIIMFITQTQPTKTTMICTAWKFALKKYKHLNIVFFLIPSGHVMRQAVRCWIPTAQPCILCQVMSYKICSVWSGIGTGFSEFLQFSPCSTEGVTALIRQHINTSLVFKLGGFISNPALVWLQGKKVNYLILA